MKYWAFLKENIRLDYILLFAVFFGVVRMFLLILSDKSDRPTVDEVLLVSDITSVHGEVFIWKNGKSIQAEKGQELSVGDSLVTKGDGLVTVRLPDGSNARISENSSLFLKRISPKNPTLEIRTGQIRMDRTYWPWTLNGPKGSINTGRNPFRDGEATSLGLVMRVGRRVSLAVYQGFATWKTDGKTIEIPAGKAAYLRRTDETPTTVDLPQPPSLVEPRTGSTFTSGLLRAGVDIKWEVTPPSEFYRIEIRRIDDSTAFTTRFETVRDPYFLLRNLGVGTYTLRVLSSDDFGLESDWSNISMINIAGRIFDIPRETSSTPKISFRSTKQGNQFIIGGKIVGLDPKSHVALIYKLDGQWNLANWDSDFRIPLEPDGYFESAVPPAAKVAIAIVDTSAVNLPTAIPYGDFPPKDKRFKLAGVYRLN